MLGLFGSAGMGWDGMRRKPAGMGTKHAGTGLLI